MSKDLAIASKELASLYQSTADEGLQDAGNTSAFPKVKITNNLSKENLLSDNTPSKVGKLYHTELHQDFDHIECNICYIGQFDLPDFNKPEVTKMTYVVGAVKKDDNTPFVFYVKGYSLQNMWDFLKDVSSMKARYQLPMYALSCNILVTKRSHAKFKEVDTFKIVVFRKADGTPVFETDMGRATFLKDSIEKFKETIHKMVKVEETPDPYVEQSNSAEDEAYLKENGLVDDTGN